VIVEGTPAGSPSVAFAALLDRIANDAAQHMIGAPAGDDEIGEVEREVGRPLPAQLRAFLGRFGGGIFYSDHEVFGPRRLMIHDIELVPDLVSVRRRLALPPGTLAVHRGGGAVHVMRLDDGSVMGASGESYPDFAAFLLAVVVR